MRIIVYGVGAIGGAMAGALARAGREVVGVARGARLAALRDRGLWLRSPQIDERVRFPVVGDPGELSLRAGDAVVLAMKTQHTDAALDRLRAAGWGDGPIFCAQNGVANEPMALRRFPNVHGMVVMLPASSLADDDATVFCGPTLGLFETGRAPAGRDADDAAMAQALTGAGFACDVVDDVMAAKRGKLLLNLNNILQAAVGRGAEPPVVRDRLRAEAAAVLRAAGLDWREIGPDDPRRDSWRDTDVPGVRRVGGSTAQDLARGAAGVETDYLNGEIAMLARLHGVAAPLNAAMTALAARLARDGAGAGAMTPAALEAFVREAGADM